MTYVRTGRTAAARERIQASSYDQKAIQDQLHNLSQRIWLLEQDLNRAIDVKGLLRTHSASHAQICAHTDPRAAQKDSEGSET